MINRAKLSGAQRRRATGEDAPLSQALADHDEGLVQAFEAIAMQCERGDLAALGSTWELVKRELLHHLDIEDQQLLRWFEANGPEPRRNLRSDHQAIREDLASLSVALTLGRFTAQAVRDFVDRLRAHAQYAIEVFYPWLEEHVPPEVWVTLDCSLLLSRAPVPGSTRRN